MPTPDKPLLPVASAEKGSRFLRRAMLLLFAALCFASIASILLYVIVHGLEQGSWELRYPAALAAALPVAVLLLAGLRRPSRLRELSPRTLAALASGLTGLCLLLELLHVWALPLEPIGDTQVFFRAATDLTEGAALRDSRYLALFPHILGYSNFLMLLFRLTGSTEIAPAVNTLLTSGTGLLLFLLCYRCRGWKHAVVAFLLWILCPSKTLYDSMILSEPLYTFLILLVFFLLSELVRRETGAKHPVLLGILAGALLGLLLGLIQAVRPIAPILLIALAIWLLLLRLPKLGERRSRRLWLPLAAVLVAVYLICGRAWDGILSRELGEEPAHSVGYSLYTGLNVEGSGTHNESYTVLLYGYRDLPGATAQSAQQDMLRALKLRLRTEKIDYLRLMAEKLKVFLGSDEAASEYVSDASGGRDMTISAFLSDLWCYALLLAAALAALRKGSDVRPDVLLLAPLYVLGLSLAHMLIEVAGRYHYSILPMLILTALCLDGAPLPEGGERRCSHVSPLPPA